MHDSSRLSESLAESLARARLFAQHSAGLSGLLAIIALSVLGLPFVILVPALSLLSRHSDSQPLLAIPITLLTALALSLAALLTFRLQSQRQLAAFEGLLANARHELLALNPEEENAGLRELLAAHPEQYLRIIAPQAESLALPRGFEYNAALLASALFGLLDPWRDRLLRQSAAISALCLLALESAADNEAAQGRPGG